MSSIQASSLTRFLTNVKISMAPFSPASKSSKIFLSRIVTSDAINANPTLKIVTDTHADVNKPPVLSVTYKDGKTLELQTAEMNINDVLRQVGRHARKLQEKEDALA
ncbi:39S ribosomal protein L44, mitochondrial [Actinomortierella wolfii]|nr:39S ribosomal protein L44, mitochondrial [Actinomortierella wolfii]KAG0233716.1 39S ribosomal protein L44, mitochondrial [Actinomortierella wolfii]